jgi:hypothetical protein
MDRVGGEVIVADNEPQHGGVWADNGIVGGKHPDEYGHYVSQFKSDGSFYFTSFDNDLGPDSFTCVLEFTLEINQQSYTFNSKPFKVAMDITDTDADVIGNDIAAFPSVI